MKSSKKVLAFALAAAMVVTAVPATNAQAASTAKLSATKSSVYSGGYKTVTVTTPKTWKNVKVTATSNKKTVATVKKTAAKKIKVTGVKPGTAKVTVKVTYKTSTKKTAKTQTKKLNYTLKVAKASIALSGDSEVAVGNTTTLNAKIVASSRAKVTYTSSDDSIATVDSTGNVTAVKPGKVTITANLVIGKDTATATKDVEVKKVILKSVAQTEYNKLDAVIVGDTKDLKASDFKITNNATHATVPVKSVKAKKNTADTYTIETFNGMTDAKEYTVEYAGASTTFTATDGTVASVGVSTDSIAAASATDVRMVTKDKDGIILSYTDLDKTDSSKGKTTAEVKLTKGYQDGTKLYLPAVGDTASIKVTYHSGSYGTDGKEAGNIEGTFTVTAVDPSLINLQYKVTVGASTAMPAWKATSFKANTNVKMKDNDANAFFYITKENDNTEINSTDYSDYSVESADKTKLLVASGTLSPASGFDGSTAVALKAVSTGKTYILIKKADKVVGTVAVDVVAESVATTFDMDRTSLTVVSGKNVVENVKLTLKDQYSDEMKPIDNLSVTLLGKPSKSVVLNGIDGGKDVTNLGVIGTNAATGTVSISGAAFSATNDLGTYTFKISAKKNDKTLDRTLVVNVVKASSASTSYALKMNQAEVDTTIGTGTVNAADTDITVNVANMANGGALSYYAASDIKYTVKNSKGDVIACVGDNFTNTTAGVKTCAAVSAPYLTNSGELVIKPVTPNGASKFDKNLEAGTYTVTAEFKDNTTNKPVTLVGSFTIKDTQVATATYEFASNDFAGNTVEQAFEGAVVNGQQLVKVYYDGITQSITSGDVIEVKGKALNNGGAFVDTVKLYVTVSGSNNKIPVTIKVNDQVANCNPGGTNFVE